MTTGFARSRPASARIWLAATLALIVTGLVLSTAPIPPERFTTGDPMKTDGALYGAVATRVAKGEPYYAAVTEEHRARGYPLRPFVTVRLPTLAWGLAAIGPLAAQLLLNLLVVATITIMALRLRPSFGSLAGQVGAAGCCALGAVMLANPDFTVWHEAWAGFLIALSLACRGERRFGASLAFGFAAVAIRELAAPYLLVMAACALHERRRPEALAWLGALVAFGIALAWHAEAVAAHLLPDDPASPGWTGLGGWRLVLTMIRATSPLDFAPLWLAAIVVPLALLGWCAWPDPTGRRGALALAGYCGAFTVIGRENNVYWGLLLAPLLFTGLTFVPGALRDLWRAATATRDAPARRAAASPL